MEIFEEGCRNFDLKPLTEEEVAWLEEHFMDFCREYWVTESELVDAKTIAEGFEDSRVYVVVPEGVTKVDLEFSQRDS